MSLSTIVSKQVPKGLSLGLPSARGVISNVTSPRARERGVKCLFIPVG